MSSEKETKEHEQAEKETSQAAETQSVSSACSQEYAETQEKLLRVTADFQNYKSRIERERLHSIQLGQVAVLGKLLSIIDDVDRAIEEAQKKEADASWLAGFELISKSLYQLLADHKIAEIEQMKTFDPELHEALAQVESSDYESGAIIEVMQKGYMLDDRVLRPAKVMVAK